MIIYEIERKEKWIEIGGNPKKKWKEFVKTSPISRKV